MRVYRIFSSWAALAAIVVIATSSRSDAQPTGTAFTYQGKLGDGAVPAGGSYDFEISLWDGPSTGTQVGSTLEVGDVAVTGGLFTVVLDFGNQFSGNARWLQIRVRPGAETGPFTTLSPRQQITPAPVAIHAASADVADLLDGLDSLSFAGAAHAHDATDINAGQVGEAFIDGAIARDAEIIGLVLAGDGAGSTLDADLLDGMDSAAYSTDAERDAAIAAAVAVLQPSPAPPLAPTELRILPSLRAAPYRRLVWNVAGFGGMANFVVYESSLPITDANKASAIQRFVSTTELELAFFVNSGIRFFRVAALNFAGDEGPLSNEYGLDTTARVAYIADQENDEIFELYVAPGTGGGSAVKVNAPFLTTSDVTQFVFSPDGARIAYRADQDADEVFELYVAPAAGGGSAVKVNGPLVTGGDVTFNVGGFEFSPDGARIAYLADQETDGIDELYVAPAAGGAVPVKVHPPLVTGGRVLLFAFSPDGARIAYRADQDIQNVFELYVAPAAGGGASVKVNPPFQPGMGMAVFQFAFSPDGARIAYWASQVSGTELFVAPSSGGGAFVKINPPVVFGGSVFSNFAFSPDSARIAYQAAQDTATDAELYVAPASGGGLSIKINPPLVTGGDVFPWVFSPDGARIAYRADQDTDDVFELYVAPASGGGTAVKINPALVTGGDVFNPGGFALSPDGARIAYKADQETDGVNELYVAPIAGGGAVVKVNPPLLSTTSVSQFAFSPDGARIVYVASQDANGVNELYVAPASGGGVSLKVNAPLVTGGDVKFNGFAISPLGFVP